MRKYTLLLCLAIVMASCNTTPVRVGSQSAIALVAAKHNWKPFELGQAIAYWEKFSSSTAGDEFQSVTLIGVIDEMAKHYNIPPSGVAGMLIEYYILNNNPDLP